MSDADSAQDHQDALDEISCAFAQIKSGCSLLRDEAHSINNHRELEERLIFLVDALEGLAKAGTEAFDRLERAL